MAVGLVLLAVAVLLLAPFGSQQEAVSVSAPAVGQQESVPVTPGQRVAVVERVSLLEHEGPTVLIPLAVPVVLVLLGVAAGWFARPKPVRTIAAGLLAAFVVVGAMSIGVFFLPAAIALGVAAARTPGATPSRHRR